MSDKDSLEKQNITNLIEFYEAELRLVLEGTSAEEVFNKKERRRLRVKGILGYNYSDLGWFITVKAKEILNT
jgi:hypothetical protein